MPEQVLSAKLNVPNVGKNTVRRDRLLNRLNGAMELGQRLVLVLAPAGFGKTTLISDWLRGAKTPYTWISLDSGDGDVQSFISSIVAGASREIASIENSVVRNKDGQFNIDATLIAILNHIENMVRPYILVLDDLHLAQKDEVERVVSFMLNHAPVNLHIIVTTRNALNIPLARLRTLNSLAEIDATDLLMNKEETRNFLTVSMGLKPSHDVVDLLLDKTEGWVAGLQLAAISLGDGVSIERLTQSREPINRSVFDFLIEEVFAKQSAEVQNFLMCTASLEKFCPSLCDFVLKEQAPASLEIINYLQRANLFVISLDENLRWFRYHHLFQESLRIMQARQHGADRNSELLVQASLWFEQHNDLQSAFYYAALARRDERMASLCERTWESHSTSFKLHEWLSHLDAVSNDYLLRSPVLMVQVAWALMAAGQFDLSEQRLAEAERSLKEDQSKLVIVVKEQFAQIHARISFVRAYNAQNRGNTQRAIDCAEHLLEITSEETDHFLRAQARAVLAASYWTLGNHDAAHAALREWVGHARRTGNIFFAVAGSAGMAQLRADQGLLVDAIEHFQACIREVQEMPGGGGQLISHLLLGLALLHLERGNEDEALTFLQKAKGRGVESTLPDWTYRYHVGMARFSEVSGRYTDALFHLDEAQRFFVVGLTPEVKSIEIQKVGIYLLQGDQVRIHNWLARNPIAFDASVNYLSEYLVLTQLRCYLKLDRFARDLNQLSAAIGLLKRYADFAREQNRARSLFELMAMQLQLGFLGARDELDESLFRQLLQLGYDQGYFRMWQNCGSLIEPSLRDEHRRLGQGSSRLSQSLQRYFDKILHTYAAKPEPEIISVDALTERELAVLKLIAEGLSNEEICARLFLALDTVKGHNRRIFNKLQVRRRTEAVVKAQKLGLL